MKPIIVKTSNGFEPAFWSEEYREYIIEPGNVYQDREDLEELIQSGKVYRDMWEDDLK